MHLLCVKGLAHGRYYCPISNIGNNIQRVEVILWIDAIYWNNQKMFDIIEALSYIETCVESIAQYIKNIYVYVYIYHIRRERLEILSHLCEPPPPNIIDAILSFQ